ncbi:MAG: HD domain-containing protein [bacterium]
MLNFPYLNIIKKINEVALDLQYEVYLVGGFLRDLIVGEVRKPDLDIAVKENSTISSIFNNKQLTTDSRHSTSQIARSISQKFVTSFFTLDENRGIFRVIYKENSILWSIDITKINGERIEDDLRRRDFTLNSIAIRLCDLLKEEWKDYLIDPLGGINDIKWKKINLSSYEAICEDPLRMLRAIRLASQLNFILDDSIIKSIKVYSSLINTCAQERIRDELFQIFNAPTASIYIRRMDELGLLEQIIPEINLMKKLDQGNYHYYPLWEHSLKTLEYVERIFLNLSDIFHELSDRVNNLLEFQVENFINLRSLLKLAALFHDLGKPATRSIEEDGRVRFFHHEVKGEEISKVINHSLRLSNEASKVIQTIIRYHMRPFILFSEDKSTKKALFRFCRDTHPFLPLLCILAIADAEATNPPEMAASPEFGKLLLMAYKVIGYYYEDYLAPKRERLLSGYDIMKHLTIGPGPIVGKLLLELDDVQAEGIIKTKEDALEWLEKYHE